MAEELVLVPKIKYEHLLKKLNVQPKEEARDSWDPSLHKEQRSVPDEPSLHVENNDVRAESSFTSKQRDNENGANERNLKDDINYSDESLLMKPLKRRYVEKSVSRMDFGRKSDHHVSKSKRWINYRV